MRTHCIAGGTLLQALWWPKQEENLKESGRTYMSNSFTLLDSRNWHSRVKQPCSDSKKKGKTGGPEQSLWVKVLVVESCLALCDPMDCSPPGFSFRGILHARILEWVAIPFSMVSKHISKSISLAIVWAMFKILKNSVDWPALCLSKCGHKIRPCSISIAWELLWNDSPLATHQTHWIRNSERIQIF